MVDENLRASLQRLTPGRQAVRKWLRQHVDESMLDSVSRADYGTDAEKHLHRLRPMRDGATGVDMTSGCPAEVLELTRWSQPPRGDRRGHTARLFACALLIEAGQDPRYVGYILSETDTLAQFVDSCLSLGPVVQKAGLQLVAWRCTVWRPQDEDLAFFAVAALMLAALVVTADQELIIPQLAALAERTVEEQETGPIGRMGDWQGHWLLGLTCHTIKARVWIRLASEILLRPKRGLSAESVAALERIGRRMTEGQASR